MKKITILILALVLTLCLAVMATPVAYADAGISIVATDTVDIPSDVATTESVETEVMTPQTEFFSWATLATYAGAVLFATLVTQFVKKITWLQKVPTQVICYVIATIGLLAGTYFSGTLTISSAALCLVNGLVVAVAANGTYDNIKYSAPIAYGIEMIGEQADPDDE